MRFRTNLRPSPDHLEIDLDLAQMPSVWIPSRTNCEIQILGSFYTVREILYRDGGKVELILWLKEAKLNSASLPYLLLEYSEIKENLVCLSLRTRNDLDLEINIYRVPEGTQEFVEKDGRVYQLAYAHLMDDNKTEALSLNEWPIADFYKLNEVFPYRPKPNQLER